MHRRLILTGLAALLISTPRPGLAQPDTQTFERTFTVSGDATLDAASDSGSISVRAGTGNTVVVRGRVQARRNGPANAADLVRQVIAQPPVVHEGNTVRLGRIEDETIRKAVSISYEVTVPARTAVSVRSGSGSVAVEGTALTVAARTGSGEIVVQSVGGRADLQTGSGSIRAQGVGAGLSARTGSGEITASLSGKGDVQTSTGSGSIRLSGVVGAVTASTGSGDVSVDGTPAGDWKVSAASGSVAVKVPADAGFTLDARTASGSLSVDVPLTAEVRENRRRVQGTVRGGGPALSLSTASGSISIR